MLVKRILSSLILGVTLVSAPVVGAAARLTPADIEQVLAQAASKALEYTNNPIHRNAVIAVADREGYIVGACRLKSLPAGDPRFGAFLRNALGRAGTASYLSSSEHAFSTRTASFIVQQHYPAGVDNAPPGPLVGVNFSNLDRTDVNRLKSPANFNPAVTNGLNGDALRPLVTGGLTGASGGVPLYKDGQLVGGVGVCGDEAFGEPLEDKRITLGTARPTVASAVTNTLLYELLISPELVRARDIEEEVALAGQVGFAPDRRLWGSQVFAGGVSLAYVGSEPAPARSVQPLAVIADPVDGYPIVAPPPVQYPSLTLGGVTGELRQPIVDDPALHDADAANDTIRGQRRLTSAEVRGILERGAARARTTRAAIRLPRGRPMQCFIAVVANPDRDGAPPAVLGTFCTSPDTTRFSWDVSVQKARTALFFSDDTRAFSSRTVGFLAQKFFPPGIANTQPGIFRGLQERFCAFNYNVQNPLNDAIVSDPTKLFLARVPLNPNLPNGITIFPGGFPLYRDGVLVGAVGVSGDGVDQDDLVAASAAEGFPAPPDIRADRFAYRAARLPYAKFPRNPAL